MEWIKALHVIAMVAWFAGLFYLPRLYVYHCDAHDDISRDRFQIMEHKLYFYIMTPAAIITALAGFTLIHLDYAAYSHMMWLHVKLIIVFFLYVFHLYLGKWLYDFKRHRNTHSARFYRMINEMPTLVLIAVIILVFVRPWS